MIDNILKKFAKVLRRAEDTEIEDGDEDIGIVLDKDLTDDTAATSEEEENEDSKTGSDGAGSTGEDNIGDAGTAEITEITERLNAIDNEIPRLDIAVNTLRKDITEIRNELGKLDENLRDIMMLYEVVSNQINPFIGISKVTATSMEKLERLERDMDKSKESLEDIMVDLKLMTLHDLDVDTIVYEVLEEEG